MTILIMWVWSFVAVHFPRHQYVPVYRGSILSLHNPDGYVLMICIGGYNFEEIEIENIVEL